MSVLFGQMARWMSRRNGESLAKALAARMEELQDETPGRPETEYGRKALESRAGWRSVGGNRMEFRTGERVELKPELSWKEILAQITAIEVKPLGEGLSPEVQKELVEEAVVAATSWWQKKGVQAG